MSGRLFLLSCALVGTVKSTAVPTADFGVPMLVGSSDFSKPNGTKFWFPGISIPTGFHGHVAQHVTLANDGGWGAAGPEGPCGTAAHPQDCEQIMLSRDGGRSYAVIKRIPAGTSGNFNGYGDLGTWVPGRNGQQPAGTFQTIVGCNDCGSVGRGGGSGSLSRPAFLQTWVDSNDGMLTLAANRSIRFVNIPANYSLSTPSQTIVRTADGNLLLAAYGHQPHDSLYVTAFFISSDEGLSWAYTSLINKSPYMPKKTQGICEPTMATLADGRVLVAFRIDSGKPLWKAYSGDHGHSWSEAVQMVGSPGVMYGVWPQLLRMSNGALVLASGRPGIGLWISTAGDGAEWSGFDVQAMHNLNLPSDPFTNESETTSYTGLAEVEPGVVLLAYDKVGAARRGNLQKVFSVRVAVASF
jgi:hypothetical protein